MGKLGKKIALTLLAVAIACSSGAVAAFAAPSEGTLKLGNAFLDVAVNKQDGRFSIRTVQGHPLKEGDNDKPLLFPGKVPDTSFTTLRINGKDYIFGNDYGFLGAGGRFAVSPTTQGLTNQAVWETEGLEVTQTLALVDDPGNANVGNVKISYQVKNKTAKSVQVGSRILLDTMMGPQDASPVSVSGSDRFIKTETSIAGGEIPYYWKSVDDPLVPKVTAYGFLKGWGNDAPSRMVIAHWEGISATKWDYAVNRDLDFTSAMNEYGSADSAVAFYWDPAAIAPGATKVFETYYGLGNFATTLKQAKYGAQVFAPKQLTVNAAGNGYTEQPFEVKVEIDNSLIGAEPLQNAAATIGLPDELELAEGQPVSQYINRMNAGETKTVTWKVKAKPQTAFKASQFRVSVQTQGGEEVLQAAYVILPALSGEIPKLQMTSALPGNIYRFDSDPTVTISGKGFELLKNNAEVKVRLLRERDRTGFDIPWSKFSVADDKSLSVVLDDALWPEALRSEPGTYLLAIDAGKLGQFELKLEFTLDQRYKSRNYGILLAVGDKESYSLAALENEQKLADFKKNNPGKRVLLEFRGGIKEIQDGKYEIQPGATINSVVRFDEEEVSKKIYGAASQKITVQRIAAESAEKPGYVDVSGNGKLSLPNFPFEAGPFNLKLTDGKHHELNPKAGQEPVAIKWDVLKGLPLVQQIGYFPVSIMVATLGDQSVTFSGKLSLGFGVGKSKEEEDKLRVGINVQEAKFGIRKQADLFGPANQFGFLGLRAQGNAGLPDKLVPGMKFGAQGKVDIDTFARKYEIEADVKFKVFDLHGLMTLRFTESNIPIPDNMVFVIGAQPGIPVIPTTPVAYITKAGGGFKNLYDTVTGNFNVLPPLKLVLVGGFDVAKVVSGDDMTVELSLRGVEFSGKMQIAKFDILEKVYGSILLDDSLDHFAVSADLGADLNILDVVKGKVYVMMAYDTSYNGLFGPVKLAGNGNVDVYVPKQIPLVGGLKLAGAEAGISTENVYGKVYVLKIPIGFKYEWGSAFPTVAATDLGAVLGRQNGIARQFDFDPENKGRTGMLTYGTNFVPVSSSRTATKVASLGNVPLLAAAEGTDATIYIDGGKPELQDHALLEFTYHGDRPELAITDPSGKPYELKEAQTKTESDGSVTVKEGDWNFYVQEIDAASSQSGSPEKRMFVTITKPMAGNWIVSSKNGKPFEWKLTGVVEPPTLTGVNVAADSADDHEFIVNWQAEHLTGGMKAAVYLSSDKEKDPGRLVADGIDAGLGTAAIQLPDTMASGTYFAKVVLSQDGTNVDSAFADMEIRISNQYQPKALKNVTLAPAGNGTFRASWERPDASEKVDGYYLQMLDAAGKPLADTGLVEVEGVASEAIIGGTYTSEQTDRKAGVVPGASYQVSVMPYRVVEGVKVFGESAVSPSAYLAAANPAEVTLDVTGPDGKQVRRTVDGQGQVTYYVNANAARVTFASNQDVTASLQVNGETVRQGEGRGMTASVTLREGVNDLLAHAVNAQGDTTVSGVRVVSDTAAPDLKLEGTDTVEAAGGHAIRLKGTAEAGSAVTVNGESVVTDALGRFTADIPVDGRLSASIAVTAEDEAGNRTVYETQQANGQAGDIVRVEVRPAAGESTAVPALATAASSADSVKLTVGQEQPLELIGYDAQGKAYRIDPSQVEWSFLLGGERGTLNNSGVVKATEAGDLVVKASYRLSKDFALENTASIEAAASGSGTPDPTDPSPWYPPDDGGPGSGGKDDPGKNEESDPLMAVLKSIIEQEQNVKFVAYSAISGDRDTVVRIDGRATLTVPRNAIEGAAVSDGVGIGIGVVQNPQDYLSGGYRAIGDIYEMKFDKPARLGKPATLTIRFDLSSVKDLSRAAVYWYNDRVRRWEYVGGRIDPTAGTVTAELPHFSKYALLENENARIFADMQNRWSNGAVYRLASIGAVSGSVKDGRYVFEPTRAITRQEFARLLVGASGVAVSAQTLGETFADRGKAAAWAQPYLATAVDRGWLSGTPKNGKIMLEPNRPITRAEAAAIIGRVLKDALAQGDGGKTAAASFRDDASVPAWAKPAIQALQASGMLSGYPDGTFRPNGRITREEAAAMLSGMLDLLYDRGAQLK